MNYFQKYIKYKNKYLNLKLKNKNILFAGSNVMTPNNISFFIVNDNVNILDNGLIKKNDNIITRSNCIISLNSKKKEESIIINNCTINYTSTDQDIILYSKLQIINGNILINNIECHYDEILNDKYGNYFYQNNMLKFLIIKNDLFSPFIGSTNIKLLSDLLLYKRPITDKKYLIILMAQSGSGKTHARKIGLKYINKYLDYDISDKGKSFIDCSIDDYVESYIRFSDLNNGSNILKELLPKLEDAYTPDMIFNILFKKGDNDNLVLNENAPENLKSIYLTDLPKVTKKIYFDIRNRNMDLQKYLTIKSMDLNLNVFLEITGLYIDSIKYILQKAKSKNYNIIYVYPSIPNDYDHGKRLFLRALNTGKIFDLLTIMNEKKIIYENFLNLLNNEDHFILYENYYGLNKLIEDDQLFNINFEFIDNFNNIKMDKNVFYVKTEKK